MPPPGRTRAATAAAPTATAAWLLLHGWRAIVGHLSLSTNACDRSVFGHALWSFGHGGLGFVSFLGHSILSHHFVPSVALPLPARPGCSAGRRGWPSRRSPC